MKLRVLLVLLLISCIDAQHGDAVSDLGPEINGERPGPDHRAGQPCTTCHSGKGPGSPEFVMAGTVYAARESLVAMPGVTVVMTDAHGSTVTSVSNRVGNFYVESSRWTPTYPVYVEMQYGSFTKAMKTPIGRNGGCGFCHQGVGDASHDPAVFLKDVGE